MFNGLCASVYFFFYEYKHDQKHYFANKLTKS